MTKIINVIFILVATLCLGMNDKNHASKSYSTTPINLEIVATYEMNAKVWGTYVLDSELIYKVQNNQKTLVLKNTNKHIKESLLFNKNRLFFIHNQSNERNKGKLSIKSFSYTHMKSILTIELYKNKNDYFDLNYSKLSEIVSQIDPESKNNFQGPEYLYVGNMNCKKNKNKYVCKTGLTLSLI